MYRIGVIFINPGRAPEIVPSHPVQPVVDQRPFAHAAKGHKGDGGGLTVIPGGIQDGRLFFPAEEVFPNYGQLGRE